jgi:membrane-associated phospholipid phosphatase
LKQRVELITREHHAGLLEDHGPEPLDDHVLARVLVGVAIAIIGALTALVWHHRGPIALDRVLLHGYVPHEHSMVFRATKVATDLGSPGVVIVVAFAAAAVVWRRRRSLIEASMCVLAPGIGGVVESTAKIIVDRTRPMTAALTGESGVGFPSGHATGFTALALTLVFVFAKPDSPTSRRVAAVVAVILSVLMGVSRVIVGAHYPTDAMAGVLLGFVIAELTQLLAPVVTDADPP